MPTMSMSALGVKRTSLIRRLAYRQAVYSGSPYWWATTNALFTGLGFTTEAWGNHWISS
jgi:hypothetical protein